MFSRTPIIATIASLLKPPFSKGGLEGLSERFYIGIGHSTGQLINVQPHADHRNHCFLAEASLLKGRFGGIV